jgi:hypothetical protein
MVHTWRWNILSRSTREKSSSSNPFGPVIKSALLAVVLFFGSVCVAEAQVFVNGGVPGPATTLGWNVAKVSLCLTLDDGVNTLYVAYFEGGGHAFTNNPGFPVLAAPACQTGNLMAIHVISLNPFSWNSIVTFPHK